MSRGRDSCGQGRQLRLPRWPGWAGDATPSSRFLGTRRRGRRRSSGQADGPVHGCYDRSGLIRAIVAAAIWLLVGAPPPSRAAPEAAGGAPGALLTADPRFAIDELLASDDFSSGLGQWSVELEAGGTVTARGRALVIDVPAGCTVWFRRPLEGPLLITYEATVIDAGGANDRVSDLNCFWMATDARSPADIFATRRSGRFADYDELRCYYVGLGGNGNTTTRFRRYIGQSGNRPLRPEHDLSAPEFLIVPNVVQRIQLMAAGRTIGFFRDGRRLFAFDDPQPYRRGWFGFRTVHSRLRIRSFKVFRLVPAGQ